MRPDNQTELESHIRACIAGDEQAFRPVFDCLKERVFQYVVSRSNSREDALDITQDIFVDIWKALRKFDYRSLGQFYGFVFLVARRRLIKYYRSRPKHVELTDDQLLPSMVNHDQPHFDDHHDLLVNIKRLKGKYQEILRLRYWSGLSYAEAAAVLKISESAAKVWHHRAIKKLQEIFNQQ